jgi:hypothetical protein
VYEDVKANEPGTKKYHIGVDTKNSDTIWLWEEVRRFYSVSDEPADQDSTRAMRLFRMVSHCCERLDILILGTC